MCVCFGCVTGVLVGRAAMDNGGRGMPGGWVAVMYS